MYESYEYRRIKGSLDDIRKAIINLPPGTSAVVNGIMNRHTVAHRDAVAGLARAQVLRQPADELLRA